MTSFNIRDATHLDCEDILRMIKELAVYSKMADQVTITANDLRRDVFGENKFCHVVVAELTEGSGGGQRPLVGYLVYCYTYNPWYGRSCFLEDFYVMEEWRQRGIGSALWATVTQRALAMQCQFVKWEVLDWNHRSIKFYKDRGARDITGEEGRLLFKLDRPDMERLVEHTLSTDTATTL
ncbi:diamine acetyltransferase 1-like [Babylonia areolata]|uniref:diamine acetyltransferase 1-like n=1 Tax=Babylonia areolata TaxID=304850 RepID=UPI003FD1D357